MNSVVTVWTLWWRKWKVRDPAGIQTTVTKCVSCSIKKQRLSHFEWLVSKGLDSAVWGGIRWRRNSEVGRQGAVIREFSRLGMRGRGWGRRQIQFVCFIREHGFYFISCSLKSRHVWRWGVWFISIPAPVPSVTPTPRPQSVIENFQYICATLLLLL